NITQSVCAKSSIFTVPTGTPMVCGRATDVLSWHMLELSGRLLLPYMRANSAYVRSLERSPPGAVKNHFLRIERLQFKADFAKGLGPPHWHVLVGRSIPAQRVSQPPVRIREPLRGTCSRARLRPRDWTEPQPPAGWV